MCHRKIDLDFFFRDKSQVQIIYNNYNVIEPLLQNK